MSQFNQFDRTSINILMVYVVRQNEFIQSMLDRLDRVERILGKLEARDLAIDYDALSVISRSKSVAANKSVAKQRRQPARRIKVRRDSGKIQMTGKIHKF